jgi:hypothetical protein
VVPAVAQTSTSRPRSEPLVTVADTRRQGTVAGIEPSVARSSTVPSHCSVDVPVTVAVG